MTKAQLGVTMHGQRAGSTSDEYEDATGYLPPIKGGVPVKPGLPRKIDRELHRQGELRVAKHTGHHRPQVAASYFGSYGHSLRPTKSDPVLKEAGSISPQPEVASSSGDSLSFGFPQGQTIVYNGHTMYWPV